MITPEKLLEMAVNLSETDSQREITEERLMSAAHRMEAQGIKEARFFEQYGDDITPFQKGSVIKIKKGAIITTRKGEQTAQKDYTVTVHTVYPGFSALASFDPYNNSRNPTVVWSGSHGWHETDLNNVEVVA